MNIPIKYKSEIFNPPAGYAFPFIDKDDMQLKAKLSDGIVINYTNLNEDIKIISLTEYSSFEVMPNKEAIAAGSKDTKTGLIYSISIPACTVHKFTLRSANPVDDNDVIIDWGDGTIEAIKDGKYEWKSNKSYELVHDYSEKMTETSQKFIVKIYGRNYYTFRNNSYKDNNLISRIFDADLPIANHISNFASMCYGATRLLKVKFPHSTKYVTDAYNFASTFEFATNLISVTGFEDNPLNSDCIVANIFNGDVSLQETDFVIPKGVTSIAGVFHDCKSLSTDISKIIPSNGFAYDNINAGAAFANTPSLTGVIPDYLLWNSGKTFKSQSAFYQSSLSSQAPKSWGGTLEDLIIKPSFEERLEAMEKILKENNFLAL